MCQALQKLSKSQISTRNRSTTSDFCATFIGNDLRVVLLCMLYLLLQNSISAWANKQSLVLGQVKTDEKSNEITAVPQLLDLLDIEDCVVTADAMSCQKDIVKKIASKKADYVIGLKGNQETLHKDVQLYFSSFQDVPRNVTKEKGHGRMEVREYYPETDIIWLWQRPQWRKFCGCTAYCTGFVEKG